MTVLAQETETTLEEIALRSGKTTGQLAHEAVKRYAAWYDFEEKKIAEAEAAFDRGEFIEQDELFDELEKRYSE